MEKIDNCVKLWVFRFFIENENELAAMKDRLQNADEKNQNLVSALNDTLGKLSAIPNGM